MNDEAIDFRLSGAAFARVIALKATRSNLVQVEQVKPSHLLTIAALLELLNQPIQRRRNQSAVISEILERHPGKRGLSKRNLEDIFGAANTAAKEKEAE